MFIIVSYSAQNLAKNMVNREVEHAKVAKPEPRLGIWAPYASIRNSNGFCIYACIT